MDLERRLKLTGQIEHGAIKLFVATTIFNVGFDAKDLRVVCRADCGSTRIADCQIPGRNARFSKDGTKEVGILYDYRDKFDSGLEQRFYNRQRNYQKQGWKIRKLGAKKSSLRRKMGW